MAKLTDRQKKQIIAESVEGSSLRALGAKYGVSPTTIRRVLLHNPEFKQKVTQKKQENTASVLAFMESQKQDVCKVIDNLLHAINDPEKMAAALFCGAGVGPLFGGRLQILVQLQPGKSAALVLSGVDLPS